MKSSVLDFFCPSFILNDVATVLKSEKCSTKTQEVSLKIFRRILQDCASFKMDSVKHPEFKELHAKVERIYKQTIQPFLALQTENLCHQLRNSPGDIVIDCMNGEVSAHKSVLLSFKGSFLEHIQDRIHLLDYSTEAVNLGLDLIYQTLDINDIDFEDLLELHKLLNDLTLTDFIAKCEKAMEQCLKLYERPSLTNWIKDHSHSLPKQIPGWKLDSASQRALYERHRIEADLGDALAMNNLGFCLENGIGVIKDKKEAVVWYRRAAELGNSWSMNSLGYCLQHGIGIDKDEKEAIIWYTKAAELGHSTGMNNLGYYLQHGIGIEKDEKEAVVWYRRAAELGLLSGMNNLGSCLRCGIGIEKDEKEAIAWYTKAAELGHSSGMNNLGYCLQHGIGIDKDEKEAIVWYTKAAKLGNYHSMYNLGICYEAGLGVAKDKAQAVIWYTKAADLGHTKAREAIAELA